MLRNASRLHYNVVINKLPARIPRCYFLHRPAERERELFVTGFKRTIPKVAKYLCGLFLSSAAIIDDVLRQVPSRRSTLASSQRFGKQIGEY